MAIKVAVIGAGPGGYIAALRAAQMGADVTVIEKDNAGGTCLNWGCMPSKIMVAAAEMLEKFQQAQEFGLRVEGKVVPDMQRLMARKQKIIHDQSMRILELLEHQHIRYVHGRGVVTRHGLAAAHLDDGTVLEVPWGRLILAPGTRPLEFPDFPFDGKRIISSNDALSLQEVPESIVILGGGVIGCEFAFILASLGSRVTLVEAMDRLLPLPSVDEDCSKVIQREMKKRKIKFILNRTVQKVEHSDGGVRVTVGSWPPGLKDDQETPSVLEAEKLLVSVGRMPNTTGMGIEALGVKLDPQGWIIADERMETSVSGVYAIGDALGPSRIMLAHVASAEGLVAAENAVSGNRAMDYTVVPGAIFTMPEVANVGLTVRQARERGYSVRADSVLFRTLGKPHAIGEIAGEAKIVSDAETGRILGVHIVGPHATDLIAEGTLAVKMGSTVKDLADTIHAHPTVSEVMAEASFKALDRSLLG